MRRSVLFIAALFVLFSATAAEKSYKLISIDGRIEVTICVGEKLSYTIDYDHKRVLEPSDIALYLADGVVLGQQCRLSKVSRGAVNSFIEAKFYHRNTISERYNSIKLDFKGSYGVEFRAYDEGVCYRFSTSGTPRRRAKRSALCGSPKQTKESALPQLSRMDISNPKMIPNNGLLMMRRQELFVIFLN